MKIQYQQTKQKRIDKFLSEKNFEELYSRSYIDNLIENGYIKVNNNRVKKSYKLNYNDEILIEIPQQKNTELNPQPIELDFIYEDEYLAVINKPADISVHPGAGNPDGTIVNGLIYHLKNQLSSGYYPKRPGIVHRLDKDTSGLLVIAKNDKVQSLLSQKFQNKEIEKIYRAISVGIPTADTGTIETYINRSLNNRTKMAVSKNGKKAVTHYKILKKFDFFSYLEIQLETGRTHQIRVHFSHINCPILGDPVYSSTKRTLNYLPENLKKKAKYLLANHLKRQALHAYRLKFEHPITKKILQVEAKLPNDIQYTLQWAQKYFYTE
ncbi:MAG: RluA family pseudouridine synthase [Candidatus Cloacimonadota bacterium]|nr:RluA family pseudouridine synthase [Candidatus Cloacimonadota bacterium]